MFEPNEKDPFSSNDNNHVEDAIAFLALLALVVIVALIIAWIPSIANAKYERDYQADFCTDGVIEYVLDDKTRVDCLTTEYAIEMDFAKSTKVFEGISQSLHYAMKTGKKAKLVIIIEEAKQIKHYRMAMELVEFYDLPVEIEYMSDNEKVHDELL